MNVEDSAGPATTSPPFPLKSMVSFTLGAGVMFATALAFIQWNVDHTIDSLNRQVEMLSSLTDSKLATLDARMEALDITVDQVDGKVASVDSTMAVAEVESVKVKDDVVEVKLKVDEIRSGLDDTSGKIDSLKTILNVAFQNDSGIRILLDDERLSELLPVEFFQDEPSRGAALPKAGMRASEEATTTVTDRARAGESGRPHGLTIAARCMNEDGPKTVCYEHYLARYVSRQRR